MSLDATIRAVQKQLAVKVDGKPGPATWGAIHLAVVGKKAAPKAGLDAIIRAVQKKLGVYVDGNPGPNTWGAIHKAVVGKKAPDVIPKPADTGLTGEGKKADSRSEANIATLHVKVRPYVRALIENAVGQGIIIKVTSAMRTYAEQDKLYAQGRTAPGKIVTYAKGGYSNHNFGIAVDITIFKGSTDPEQAKTPVWDSPLYKVVGSIGMDLGLDWGGSWTSFKDEPHFQLRPTWAAGMKESAMLTELRRRKAAGIDFYA